MTNPNSPEAPIVFVCEHGSAKSVVAAAHFNRLAVESGLPYRAVSRGTDPDPGNHPSAIAGLAADGLDVQSEPRRLMQSDIDAARRVISFGKLPIEYSAGKVEVWSAPPVSENYELARTSIVEQARALLDSLA